MAVTPLRTNSPAHRAPLPGRALLLASVVFLAGSLGASAAELPLRRVVLSTSGLAQFTHAGPVTGGSTIDLPVRLDQVDDILKSLTVFDALGAVGTVSLPGREPLDQLFRDLPFDAKALEGPLSLINALVGTEVEIKGPVDARGRILKVTRETVHTPEGRDSTIRHRLSLITDRGIVQAVFEDITSLAFTDPQTRAQIDRALTGLMENRAKDRRTLSIGLTGKGEREVGVGYVVSAPIWKTSWRLVLPKDDAKGGKGAKARLQGWAVLENLTGGDWKDVDLTLVSGNPVALTQPLYTSVYGKREEVPLAGTTAPSIVAPPPPRMARKAARSGMAPSAMQEMAGRAQMAMPAPAPVGVAPMASIADSVATEAEEAATQMLYRFPNRISLATGHTMMVPFVDREIGVERVWLFQPGLHEKRPFAAARLINDGDTGLPPGIVTAFETGGDGVTNHVGDALLPQLPRGSQKFVTFALDTKTEVRREDKGVRRTVLGTAVDGKLTTTIKSRQVIAYEVTAPADEDRDVLVEEERPVGWAPAAEITDVETTPTALRRHIRAAKGTTAKSELALERIDHQIVTLTTLAPEEILAQVSGLSNEGPALRQAIDQLAEVVGDITRAEAQKERIETEHRKIAEDQERIRKNLASAGQSSDLGRRYLDTLRKQEDQLAELAKTDQALDATIAAKRKAAEEIARKLKL
jgi:hypothetical protein